MSHRPMTFDSAGAACAGLHFAAHGVPEGTARPAVVMAHGFAGTVDSGLVPFAEQFQAAGFDVLAFDYRGFGASEGQPRQTISIQRQIQDYHAAVTAAQGLPDVDSTRIALWGSSLSGGHVLRVAAERDGIAAVIAMTPMTNALSTGRHVIAQYGLGSALRSAGLGVRSRVATTRGGSAVMIPVVSRPGGGGALALDGAYESYVGMAGPSWHNEIDAGVGLQLSRISTAKSARALRCPLLVQIADFDRYVPAEAVARTAVLGRGIVHHYPCDHFDVWPGHGWFGPAVADQLRFLRRSLT